MTPAEGGSPDQPPPPFGRRDYDNVNDPVTRLERIARVIQLVGFPVVLAIILAGILFWDQRQTNGRILSVLDRLAFYQQQACLNNAGDDPAAIARCNIVQQPPR